MIYNIPADGGLPGRIVPCHGFPVTLSANQVGDGDEDHDSRKQNIYSLNLGDIIGLFSEGFSKILNTAFLGKFKLDIVFTSLMAFYIWGSKCRG